MDLNVVINTPDVYNIISFREHKDNTVSEYLFRIGNEELRVGNKKLIKKEFNLHKNPGVTGLFLLEDKYVGDDKGCFH